jgi:predicted DNA-binding transcriptional regulator YafY
MNRIDRLFGILVLLQSKKYVTAEAISEKFGISVRTVYRDVKALCEQGVPVSFEQHRGYFIVQGYFLPPVSFSFEEASALLLMENLVYGFTDRSVHKNYSSAFNKIKSVLRGSQKEKIEALEKKIKLQLPSRFTNDFDYLTVLQETISSKHIAELEYRNNNNEVSKRMIEPIGLIFYAFSWHVIGWFHMRQDYRDFKIVRILKVKNTGTPFTKEDHVLLNDYMKLLPVSY